MHIETVVIGAVPSNENQANLSSKEGCGQDLKQKPETLEKKVERCLVRMIENMRIMNDRAGGGVRQAIFNETVQNICHTARQHAVEAVHYYEG